MGLFLRQEDDRSQLQSKIVADLQQKLKQTAQIEGDDTYEPTVLENQHETRSAGVVIGLLVVVLIGVIVFVIVRAR